MTRRPSVVYLLDPDPRILPGECASDRAAHIIGAPDELSLASDAPAPSRFACTLYPGETCDHGFFCTSDWFHPRLQERRAALQPPPVVVPAPLTFDVLDEDDGSPE